MTANAEELKRLAAIAALDEVKPGMRLGIGTGSTANAFIKVLAERVAAGLSVIGVPTSERTAALAGSLGIPLSTLEETPELDVAIDGADEIGPELSLIKGGGGALLREKIVAAAAKRFVVIADASKVVATLGKFALPIEVVPFGLGSTTIAIAAAAKALGLEGPLTLRLGADGKTFVTDGGHFILDAAFGRISDADALDEALHKIPGVVEHGLFVHMASIAYVARPEGTEIIRAPIAAARKIARTGETS